MNNIKSYIKALAIAAAATLGFSACQDDFDDPNLPVPEAKNKPTISIAELKALYWQEDPNYAITVAPWSSELADKAAQAGVNLSLDEGQHLIVSGVVLSSDEAGNVFKNLVIFDGTAALPLSINSYNLYLKYRRGQEIVLDLTGMDIGKYNGYMQVGKKEWYENGQPGKYRSWHPRHSPAVSNSTACLTSQKWTRSRFRASTSCPPPPQACRPTRDASCASTT